MSEPNPQEGMAAGDPPTTPKAPESIAPGAPPLPAPAAASTQPAGNAAPASVAKTDGGNVMVIVAAIAILLVGALVVMVVMNMAGGLEGDVITTKSGLKYIELKVGAGKTAEAGDTVEVHYTGKLTNGKVFDSSRPRGKPFSFKLGKGDVIKGWDEGVAGMKEGGKRKLIIPPALGYGERGAGKDIPPNAELHFEVELVKVQY
jgi:hypothetical protein